MTNTQGSNQTDLLNRLYNLKQKQLLQASQQTDSLLYRVLAAEAQAITDALNGRR